MACATVQMGLIVGLVMRVEPCNESGCITDVNSLIIHPVNQEVICGTRLLYWDLVPLVIGDPFVRFLHAD